MRIQIGENQSAQLKPRLMGRSADMRGENDIAHADQRRRPVHAVARKPVGETGRQGADSVSCSVTRFLCSRLSRHSVNKPAATTIEAPRMVVRAGT